MNKVRFISLAVVAATILPACSNNMPYANKSNAQVAAAQYPEALPLIRNGQYDHLPKAGTLVAEATPLRQAAPQQYAQAKPAPVQQARAPQPAAQPRAAQPQQYAQQAVQQLAPRIEWIDEPTYAQAAPAPAPQQYVQAPVQQKPAYYAPPQPQQAYAQTQIAQHRPQQQPQFQQAAYKPSTGTMSHISDDDIYNYARQLSQDIKQGGYTSQPQATPDRKHTVEELRAIGTKIFQNECGGVKSKLVHWNVGENFASMGIGHFLWHPQGPRKRQFGETFPGLLSFMKTRGVELPAWLERARRSGAPWNSRTHLARSRHTREVKDLENLLYSTRDIQAEYILKRAKKAMGKVVKSTPSHLRPLVAANLNAVSSTAGGWYALVDYVNFKGEGLNRTGGYKGQNWGLLQVLEAMKPSQPGQDALHNFSSAALYVLKRRIKNSPASRNENRWLAGWTNRVNTYRNPLL